MAEQQAAPRVHTKDRDGDMRGAEVRRGAERGTERGTETKPSFKTTELIVYALAVLGVLIASAIVDNSFGADPAWRYVTYLTVGYMISRGLAKAGSRYPQDD
ncbi:MAG: hypothetical protein AVDCRST_MAG12-1122 [uncultured Rubrobacteraceae bacterium]|uniref:Uncharacterized protein n=1 Tax=uncultured Rubrobacteraceae bacterium TaxID=349277 RepID=A0A6J4RNI8_9ACTN|nr:MAG: hypothetical protein AVDCRST_MAG12-1122 [uncultured Rubrobacteraceae bacterium]